MGNSRIFILIIILITCFGSTFGQRPGKAYRTGKSAFENQEYIRAIGWLNLAVESQKKKFNEAYILRANSYLALNREEKALNDFKIATKLFPENPLVSLKASRLSFDLGKYNQALQFATTTLDRDSANFDALKLQALALIHTGSPESGLIVCEEAQKIKKDAELLYAKALASDSLGLNDYAIAYYNQAIETNPSFKPPYHDLGRLLVKNGYIDKAIEIFSDAARRFNDIESYRLRAILYDVTGKTQSQISDITKMLTLSPARIDLYFRRALLFKKVNLLQNALADISNYIKWDTTNPRAWHLKAKILQDLFMKKKAIEAYENVLKYTSDTGIINQAEKAIYQLKKERYPPQINILSPAGPDQSTITLGENQKEVFIKGLIKDDSSIDKLYINNQEIDAKNNRFQSKITVDTTKIKVKAIDVYGNKAVKVYQILRAEKVPPKLYLQFPSNISDSTIIASRSQLTVRGYIEENSTLKELLVGGKSVDFQKKGSRYYFQDQMDVANVDTLKIRVEDYFSNSITHRFPVMIPDSIQRAESPQGKTWVLFIVSDSIGNQSINSAKQLKINMLENYQQCKIDSLLLWQNMTKEAIERKLLFELPRISKEQRIDALWIHFIGPGITQESYTYWIMNSKKDYKKYDLLNTSIFRTVMEALNHIKYKTILSESVHLGDNMISEVDSIPFNNCEQIQRFPDNGQYILSIKIENWLTYSSLIQKALSRSIESNSRCFSPVINPNQAFEIKTGTIKSLKNNFFPVVLYLK